MSGLGMGVGFAVYAPQAGGGGAIPTFHLLLETGDVLLTEAGDALHTE